MEKTANYEALLAILGGVGGALAGGYAGRKMGEQVGYDFWDHVEPGHPSSIFKHLPGSGAKQLGHAGRSLGTGVGAAGGGLAGLIGGYSLARGLSSKDEKPEKDTKDKKKKLKEKTAEDMMNKEAKQNRDAYLALNINNLFGAAMEKEAAVTAAAPKAVPKEEAQVEKKKKRTLMENIIRHVYGIGGAVAGGSMAAGLVGDDAMMHDPKLGLGATAVGTGAGLYGGLKLHDYLAKTASENPAVQNCKALAAAIGLEKEAEVDISNLGMAKAPEGVFEGVADKLMQTTQGYRNPLKGLYEQFLGNPTARVEGGDYADNRATLANILKGTAIAGGASLATYGGMKAADALSAPAEPAPKKKKAAATA